MPGYWIKKSLIKKKKIQLSINLLIVFIRRHMSSLGSSLKGFHAIWYRKETHKGTSLLKVYIFFYLMRKLASFWHLEDNWKEFFKDPSPIRIFCYMTKTYMYDVTSKWQWRMFQYKANNKTVLTVEATRIALLLFMSFTIMFRNLYVFTKFHLCHVYGATCAFFISLHNSYVFKLHVSVFDPVALSAVSSASSVLFKVWIETCWGVAKAL